ncbi:sugar-binding transcriptional regulator [Lichenicoccus sp.]|uniref:sugar-binding transcriptional regulator n=1 Tax=Lichenicoccus sp. TaxID=2781899 RepID=UPI003D0DCD92
MGERIHHGAQERRIPAEFDGDPVVWSAWLYYEEGLTQHDVAQRLGISRASVNNLLQTARDTGVVTIAVAPRHLQTVALAKELADRYGCAHCLVVPNDAGRRPVHERVGHAGARLLAGQLRPDDVLGVAWGRTVYALSEAMPQLDLPGMSVVQVMGSAVGGERFTAELCTSNIAGRVRGRCIYLHAPGIVSRPAVKSVLMAEPALVEQFRIIAACNRIVFGVGSMQSISIASDGGFLLAPHEAGPAIARGAVASLAGRFIDAAGCAVPCRFDDRLIGITTDAIRAVPERICVAAGPDKVRPIRAVLAGGYVTSLVTDQRTAQALLSDP